jgi:AcrR family transcriptional regulator
MQASEASVERPGLRERKKRQTREKIAGAALRLFAEQGYDRTTLAEIADAADVSPRTIFAYFESKEDILFCDDEASFAELERALADRPPDVSTIDALRAFIAAGNPSDDNARLRKKIIHTDEALRLAGRARFARAEELIAESVARDLGAGPGDIRPTVAAASITAAFTTLIDRFEAQSGEPISHEQAIAILDEVLDFLRGGLDGTRRD